MLMPLSCGGRQSSEGLRFLGAAGRDSLRAPAHQAPSRANAAPSIVPPNMSLAQCTPSMMREKPLRMIIAPARLHAARRQRARREPCEQQVDNRRAGRMAAGVGKARLVVEMIDQVGPRTAEAELHQAGGEIREQRRPAERDGAARTAPVPDERAEQDDDDPARNAAADPAHALHEGYEGRIAFVDAQRKHVRHLPVGGSGPARTDGKAEQDRRGDQGR